MQQTLDTCWTERQLRGRMGPSRDIVDRLTDYVHTAWEAPVTAPTCASKLAASFSGEQEEQEQLRRLLLVVDALRGPLMARLKDHDANETARKRAKCGEDTQVSFCGCLYLLPSFCGMLPYGE
jgi:hypothetical protein